MYLYKFPVRMYLVKGVLEKGREIEEEQGIILYFKEKEKRGGASIVDDIVHSAHTHMLMCSFLILCFWLIIFLRMHAHMYIRMHV